jgi:hypothetical protein
MKVCMALCLIFNFLTSSAQMVIFECLGEGLILSTYSQRVVRSCLAKKK